LVEIETAFQVARPRTVEFGRPEHHHPVWLGSWQSGELTPVRKASPVGTRYRKPRVVLGIHGRVGSHDLQRLRHVGVLRLSRGTNDPIGKRNWAAGLDR